MDEVRLDLARPHQVDAGQQYPVDVEQRFDSGRGFLFEQLPLRGGKAEVMVSVVLRQAIGRNRFQFFMFWRRVDDER